MSSTLAAISRDPEFNKFLGNLGIDAIHAGPDGLAQAITSDVALFRSALGVAGLLRKDAAN
jgi:hypothetical protein